MEIRVAKNSEAHYTTITEALQAVPYSERSRILIGPGVYREKLFFEKKDLLIQGTDPEKTVISWGDGGYELLPHGRKRGTFRSYTVFAGGEKVSLKNLIIENTAGPGERAGQAIALYADAACVNAEDLVLNGFQDTLFLAPLPDKEREPGGFTGPGMLRERRLTRQYYKRCAIRGDVDFIFGGADALFEECLIGINGKSGFIAAPCECRGELGFFFLNCEIRCMGNRKEGSQGDPLMWNFQENSTRPLARDRREGSQSDPLMWNFQENSTRPLARNRRVGSQTGIFLGRPWRPGARAVFLNCQMDEGIDSRRFSGWNAAEEAVPDVYFAEAGTIRPDGTEQDLSKRNSWVIVPGEKEKGQLLSKAASFRGYFADRRGQGNDPV
ncbi:MAG: hypothetical protein K6G83_12335 [Lachnospiraceae bacterium]|nr:hypothetical protein [Lachnospiraceae bacterium]